MLQPNEKRILAVDLRSRSFGFAVFEGPTRLLDWGVKSFRQGVNEPTIPASEKLAVLMDDLSPSTIVLRKRDSDTKKRSEMCNALVREATKRRISIRLLSRNGVKDAFQSNSDRVLIAIAIAISTRSLLLWLSSYLNSPRDFLPCGKSGRARTTG